MHELTAITTTVEIPVVFTDRRIPPIVKSKEKSNQEFMFPPDHGDRRAPSCLM